MRVCTMRDASIDVRQSRHVAWEATSEVRGPAALGVV
jgi:hypothetical protein